ncbi:putative high-affinity cGMP-specific 3',5'-cyclic phosphodiesterase 9A [Neospora caninum Liverpool]|uniref:Phosphodiesterase n=1 Tax=Neospora caninum (strain Liverpool) TaxID=572307 RepID=F0VLD7_NEOCL|nr:putative high-affinity cGMP-specific 3',5'-cyclic phosphodiesterase 9A [Neospora caninum Liverpool]CBZ54065.1 putative high-affinity cGMP-specific 3',5'-cyclic phosphodiesterase 9A [Neospora caninum Liverpool]|eukprot:XP_003884096.1 putative high-affinity cGMP-specific 3',5'-cyclic phosphodiesterase 9A [Neospora caninum Liverpool]
MSDDEVQTKVGDLSNVMTATLEYKILPRLHPLSGMASLLLSSSRLTVYHLKLLKVLEKSTADIMATSINVLDYIVAEAETFQTLAYVFDHSFEKGLGIEVYINANAIRATRDQENSDLFRPYDIHVEVKGLGVCMENQKAQMMVNAKGLMDRLLLPVHSSVLIELIIRGCREISMKCAENLQTGPSKPAVQRLHEVTSEEAMPHSGLDVVTKQGTILKREAKQAGSILRMSRVCTPRERSQEDQNSVVSPRNQPSRESSVPAQFEPTEEGSADDERASAALERSDVNTENEARLLQIANPELSNLFPQRDVIPVCLYPDVNRVISAIDAVGVSTSVDDISGAIAEESQPEGLVRARCFVDEYDVSLALARYYQGLPETGPPEEPPPPATFMRKADGSGEQSEADTGGSAKCRCTAECRIINGHISVHFRNVESAQAYFNLVSKAAREGEPLTMHRLLDWDFHVLTLPPASAVLVTRDLLTQFALKANMDIPGEIIMAFSVAIFKNYRPNPYHNFYHALNVAQVLCLLLALPDVAVQFTPIDYLVLSVAALGHDLGHPGANNLFMTRFDCWPSRIYQNVSVLENYHAASLFQILRHPGFNVFCSVSATNFAPIRKRIISAILWTDMAKHFDVVAKLQAKIQGEMVLTEGIIVTLTKPYLEGLLLHAADISNPMMDFELCRDWAFRACDEFYQQNKMEEMGGFPPSMPNFQHFDEYNVAKCQVGFIGKATKTINSAGDSKERCRF